MSMEITLLDESFMCHLFMYQVVSVRCVFMHVVLFQLVARVNG